MFSTDIFLKHTLNTFFLLYKSNIFLNPISIKKPLHNINLFTFRLRDTSLEMREFGKVSRSQLNGRRERDNCSKLFRSTEYKQTRKKTELLNISAFFNTYPCYKGIGFPQPSDKAKILLNYSVQNSRLKNASKSTVGGKKEDKNN